MGRSDLGRSNRISKIERKITKGEGTWLEKNTSHLPSQSIDQTSAGNSKIFINECVVYR